MLLHITKRPREIVSAFCQELVHITSNSSSFHMNSDIFFVSPPRMCFFFQVRVLLRFLGLEHHAMLLEREEVCCNPQMMVYTFSRFA